jgi:ribonucleotide monophosphatase NagD (HAD superfamily)
MATALVLSGATRREEVEGAAVRPDFVIEDLGELMAPFDAGLSDDP